MNFGFMKIPSTSPDVGLFILLYKNKAFPLRNPENSLLVRYFIPVGLLQLIVQPLFGVT